MVDTKASINAYEYLDEVKAAILKGEDVSGVDFCEKLCSSPEGLAFVKLHYEEFTQIALDIPDTKIQLITDIIEHRSVLAGEDTEDSISRDELLAYKERGVVPSKKTVESQGLSQEPHFDSLVKKNYEEAQNSANRARAKVQTWIKNLPEGLQKEASITAEKEITRAFQKTSKPDVQDSLHAWVEKQYHNNPEVQKSFDTFLAESDIADDIIAPFEKSKAMFQEIVETPGLPADHYEKVFDYSQSVKQVSSQESLPTIRTARIETGAIHSSKAPLSPPKELAKKIETVYNQGSKETQSSIAGALSAVMGKEQAVVERAMRSATQSSIVERAIEHANRHGRAHGDGFGALFSTAATAFSTPDARAYRAAYDKSPTFEPGLEHFVQTLHFADHPKHFSISHGALQWLDFAVEAKLKKTAGSALAKTGLAAIAEKLGLVAAVPGAGWVAWGAGLLETGVNFLFSNGGSMFRSLSLPDSKEGPNTTGILFGTLGFVIFCFFGTMGFHYADRFAFTDMGTGGAGIGDGPVVDCNDPATKASNPACTFEECVGECSWPTTGIITQGPASSCGSHSDGSDSNGVDIATTGTNVEVFSVLNGTVESIYNGCEDYKGDTKSPGKDCGGGYGNHIIISGVSPADGKSYRIIYGHLQSAMNVSAGDTITAGSGATPLGKMDHTGYTTGQHLHFGVLSGGNVLDILPNNDPFPISSVQGCISNSSCGPDCPYDTVSP